MAKSKPKKLLWLIILLVVSCVIIIFALGYLVFIKFSNQPKTVQNSQTPQVTTQSPLASSGFSSVLGSAFGQYNTMSQTRYQHKTSVNSTAGTYFYDCVGFVNYSLGQSAQIANTEVRTTEHIPSGRIPSPAHYLEFFQQLSTTQYPGWQPVSKVADIQPGDILAWVNEPNNVDEKGHAVIAAGPPQQVSANTFQIAVIDSTGTPHGPDDTRITNPHNLLGPNGKPSGLGIGTIGIDADPANGKPVAIHWSISTKAVLLPIGIGRPLR